MIRNGIYAYRATMLDGVLDGDGSGVAVLRDGTVCGGNSFYYYTGSYSCSGGKWKGELTSHEHTPTFTVGPFARRIVTAGFSGTYRDDGAEFEATGLAGKRSIRTKVAFRLLKAD